MPNYKGSAAAEQHMAITSTAYTGEDTVLGLLWVDLAASLLKRCTSLNPYTYVSVEGSATAVENSFVFIALADPKAIGV